MLMLLQGITNINSVKVLLNMILESTFSLTEWCHYGIVCQMDSDTINCFKCRQDEFWTNQDVVKAIYWGADFTGTGNQSSLQRFFLNVAHDNGDDYLKPP